MKTEFASPERSTMDEINASNLFLTSFTENSLVMNMIPNIMLILNSNRQIVFANKAMLNYLGLETSTSILGLRPGELVNCVHSDQTEGGCGTTKNCIVCGAVSAILSSQEGAAADEECRILTKSNDALDYKVHCVPLDFGSERYVVFLLNDISDSKRKGVLERIFFHDILNTAGGIRGFAQLLPDATPEETIEFGAILEKLSNLLIDEIQAQRDMVAAENGELIVKQHLVNAAAEIRTVIQLYQKHPVAENKIIFAAGDTPDYSFETDSRLLNRILGNLLKNALEATPENGEVSIRGRKVLNYFVFSVHSSKFIPPVIQLQIFKRSFSTKGAGRGLGTYSVKLLTERYLEGRAGFYSDIKTGTTFYTILPIQEHCF